MTPVVWGILDLVFFAWYVTKNIWAGSVPIYSDLRTSWHTAITFGGSLPTMVASLGGILYVSILISGCCFSGEIVLVQYSRMCKCHSG
jgi:hypothetical protein